MEGFEDFFTIGPLRIDLSDIRLEGRILDIGGGGEGIIGQYKGDSVITIDKNKRELEEAPSIGDLKIIMDANDLKFLNNSFETVTAFFSLMYIPIKEHKQIFQEIYRVLKKDGEFVLWEVNIPERKESDKKKFLIFLKVKINDRLIETGYGTKWNKVQDLRYFSNLGKSIGFKIVDSKEDNNIFYLRFKKQ
ncbi:MAG: class I SAM-dependent methyltransferase [Promethearchaeota archaeon]